MNRVLLLIRVETPAQRGRARENVPLVLRENQTLLSWIGQHSHPLVCGQKIRCKDILW